MRFAVHRGKNLRIEASLRPDIPVDGAARFELTRYDTGNPIQLGDSGIKHPQKSFDFVFSAADMGGWAGTVSLGLSVQPFFLSSTKVDVDLDVFEVDPTTQVAVVCTNLDAAGNDYLFTVATSGAIASSPQFTITFIANAPALQAAAGAL
jgi:hypothetical protein